MEHVSKWVKTTSSYLKDEYEGESEEALKLRGLTKDEASEWIPFLLNLDEVVLVNRSSLKFEEDGRIMWASAVTIRNRGVYCIQMPFSKIETLLMRREEYLASLV